MDPFFKTDRLQSASDSRILLTDDGTDQTLQSNKGILDFKYPTKIAFRTQLNDTAALTVRQTAGASVFTVDTVNDKVIASAYEPLVDNTSDLGIITPTVKRFRDLRLSRDAFVGRNLTVAGTTIVQDQVIIDTNNVESLLVRQDGDAKDIFTVDTTNSLVTVNDDLKISTRLSLGSDAFGDTKLAGFQDTTTNTGDVAIALQFNFILNPAATRTGITAGIDGSISIPTGNSQNFTGKIIGGRFIHVNGTTGTITDMRGCESWFISVAGTISNWYAYRAEPVVNLGNLTTGYGFYHEGLGAGTTRWAFYANGDDSFFQGIEINDNNNITLGTTNGTQIGTATGQKLAFHGSTPIIQQTTTSQTAATFVANSSGIVDDTGTWNGYTIGDIVAILQAYGLCA